MTEPPQPPNQPPTPSGYGHLPGPPLPGYGYPPQGDNPYAQQSPYGQQQQPPQPQPVGYGFPPPPPGPPGMYPGAPGTPPKKKPVVWIAAAVAAALVVGTVGYVGFLRGDGEDPKQPVAQSSPPVDEKPSASPSVDKGDGSGDGGQEGDLNSGRKQGEDKVLWLKTSKIDGPGAGVETDGQWVVGDTVVKTVWKSVTGYAVADGKEKWTLTLPAEICAVTDQMTADGKTVLMYRDGESDTANCNQMRMIDLKAGKEGWSKEVPKEGMFDLFAGPNLSLTGDTVSVNRVTRASAFKVSTGDKLFATPSEGCQPGSYIGGNGKMIGIATCQDADHTVEVQDADPATGKTTWSFRLPKDFKVTSVYSVDPLVLDIGNEAKKERSIVVLGPDGKQRATVTGEGSFATGCGLSFSRSLQCSSGLVDSNTLYLPTSPAAGTGNEIVAFDLGTGKVKWRTPAGDKRTLTPVKAEGGQLTAYREAEYDQGGEVVTVPAAGGTPTPVLRHPSGAAAPVESSFHSPRIDYVDGRFFISVSRLLAKGKDEKLLMVFGK
ncbi:PQQ-binding-like beta-propeller repeat protein [Streptomyces sp. NBC_01408]|uniref:outer membrane protein assembly factor BamB family protein n=1 Tax=Streptomyces sp. NBC_01408 TaxID=2903855 RepID=UPI00224CAE83|nr:PQQ-binding-like beta-propeller repeat protein [Streptomyces sp. NBC_01408]MCX4692876.1 PQQ-like beta-propeller repeat protein [Streptomyces sp. NBC_01408]